MLLLYRSLVHPRMEVPIRAYSPDTRQDIEKIGKAQRRATILVPMHTHLTYKEQLTQQTQYSVEERMIRGDMTKLCKVLEGFVCGRGDEDLRKLYIPLGTPVF